MKIADLEHKIEDLQTKIAIVSAQVSIIITAWQCRDDCKFKMAAILMSEKDLLHFTVIHFVLFENLGCSLQGRFSTRTQGQRVCSRKID